MPSLELKFAVGEQALGADDRAVLEIRGRLLEAVCSHGAQTFVGDELPAFFMAMITVHEGVFLRFPVEALKLIRIFGFALLAQRTLHVVGDTRRN